MAFLFPRVAYVPARCAPARNEFAPLFSLFDDSLNELHRASRQARKTFNPRFDIKEAKDSYSVEAEVPGIDQKDISIEFVDEHTLTIKGRSERHTESGSRPTGAVEAQQKPAVEDGVATPASETESVKSHQPTIEDEDEDAPAKAESSEVAAAAQPAEPTKTENKPRYWISERRVGEFSRSFRFDARVDQDAVKASLRNGILSIDIPKAPIPESRRVQIE